MDDKSTLNLKNYFGDDLHDYPENPEDLKKFIEFEKLEILNLVGDEKYKRISRLAVHYRQLRNYDEAHELFKMASGYFEKNNPQMEMVNYLRWGDVFRFEKRFDENALIASLDAGHLAFAGIDVFENEPTQIGRAHV